MNKLLILAFIALLCACDSNGKQSQPKERPAENAPHAVSAPYSRPQHAASEAELRHADRILAFANASARYLETGFPALADIFHKNARTYLETYKLPARPGIRAKRAEALRPEQGLFDDAEAAQMTAALADMNKALEAILGHYASLEKYVADSSVRDDGARGAELVGKINTSHEHFVKARDSWLAIVQKKAAEAEQILLAQHPLKRQILAGQAVLAQIRQARDLLASGTPDRSLLAACVQNIGNEITIGAKPPFPERPPLERLYRDFLKQSEQYAQALATVVSEGAHKAQILETQAAARLCIAAWNKFAQACNGE